MRDLRDALTRAIIVAEVWAAGDPPVAAKEGSSDG
jgi:hypothetical protein